MVGIQLSALTKNLSANNLEITLGRNRDELTANITPHGLHLIRNPDVGPDRAVKVFAVAGDQHQVFTQGTCQDDGVGQAHAAVAAQARRTFHDRPG